MAPEPPPVPDGDLEAPSGARASPPWREVVFSGWLLLLAWPLTPLVIGFPFLAFTSFLEQRPRRAVAVLGAAFLPAALVSAVPSAAFLVVATLAAVLPALLLVGSARRVGYPELALSAAIGLAAASAVWAVRHPDYYVAFRAELEQAWIWQGRLWLGWARQQGFDAVTIMGLEEAVAASADVAARCWPAALFFLLWLGMGCGLTFAERASCASPERRRAVRVRESCTAFRLNDVWVWILILAMAGFLAAPAGSAAHDAAVNATVVAAGLFAWQGIAVLLYYLERRGVRLLARSILIGAGLLLLTVPLLIFALGLGLADVWLDLRSRRPPQAAG